VAVKPALAVAHYNRGTALQALGRLDEAAQSYRRVLALQPASAEAHSNLGAVLQAQGALDAAIDSYRSALAIQPDPRVHFNLGTAYRNEGRLAESVRSFESALALAPVYPDALNNLGEVLRDQGRLDEAVACFERALAQDPDTSEANYNLAVLLYDRGRPDQAARYFEASRLRDWQQRVLLCLYKTEQFNAFRAGLERLLAAPEAHAAPLLATLSAHHAANFGVTDHCGFCPHPLDFVSHGRIDALAGERSALREQLLIDMAKQRVRELDPAVPFAAHSHFLGYEGRCGAPTLFDAAYTYNLGLTAGSLILDGRTGYMATITSLSSGGVPQAIPLAGLLNIERRHGKDEFVIEKALVKMDSPAMQYFVSRRDAWAAGDLFTSPGPRQFWGPTTHQLPISVALNSGADALMFNIG